ncbi:MAG: hypothetical protein ACREME_07215, partial [Gemmatimonadales bacterium]
MIRAIRGWLGLDELDDAAAERAAQRLEEERAATHRANAEFDRGGPGPRDMLPGSSRAHRFRRKGG